MKYKRKYMLDDSDVQSNLSNRSTDTKGRPVGRVVDPNTTPPYNGKGRPKITIYGYRATVVFTCRCLNLHFLQGSLALWEVWYPDVTSMSKNTLFATVEHFQLSGTIGLYFKRTLIRIMLFSANHTQTQQVLFTIKYQAPTIHAQNMGATPID